MLPAILGTKIGMTRIIGKGGVAHTVTVVKAGPCVVMRVRTPDEDGYHAVQLGFEDVKPHRSTKAMIGHAAKAGTGPKRYVREIRLAQAPTVSQGDVVTVGQFAEGLVPFVDVTGVTKGKGFTGTMVRWGFGGLGASHGTERKHRSPGGIGAQADRLRGRCVRKGKKMAGHDGHLSRTIARLPVMKADLEHDLLVIGGSIPGPNGSLVVVREAKKKKVVQVVIPVKKGRK